MKILVAGIGNIFLGDDGFGVEVAGRLARRSMPEGVLVADFGIRGVHLAYELLGGYDALVLVDAVPLGEPPGTIAVIEPDGSDLGPADDGLEPLLDAHSMSPVVVLRTLAGLGGSVGRVVVIGCQPAVLTEGIGLSEPVAAAVDAALDAVDAVVHELCVREEEESRT
ncbi:MAG TPA: hydrogenase maturation protease [Acidimicrobiales bacterium]